MKISNELRRLREAAGLSQQELADQLEIGFSTLRSYEKGNRIPPADVIVRICRRFSVSSDFLLGLSVSEDVQPVNVPEELRHDAAAVMKAAATLCEIEGSRAFPRTVLPIYRMILQSLADITTGADESFAQLIALDSAYATTDRPGALPEELRLLLLKQVADGSVDPQLQATVKAGKDYADKVQRNINDEGVKISALIHTAIAAELSASAGQSIFKVRPVK